MPSPFTPQALAPYAQSVNASKDMGVSQGSQESKPSGPGPLYRLGQGMLLGSEALDVGTSEYGRHAKGYVESNPLYGTGEGRFLGTKAAETAGTLLAMHLLSKSHPKLAGILGLGMSIGPLRGGIGNLNLANSAPSSKDNRLSTLPRIQ